MCQAPQHGDCAPSKDFNKNCDRKFTQFRRRAVGAHLLVYISFFGFLAPTLISKSGMDRNYLPFISGNREIAHCHYSRLPSWCIPKKQIIDSGLTWNIVRPIEIYQACEEINPELISFVHFSFFEFLNSACNYTFCGGSRITRVNSIANSSPSDPFAGGVTIGSRLVKKIERKQCFRILYTKWLHCKFWPKYYIRRWHIAEPTEAIFYHSSYRAEAVIYYNSTDRSDRIQLYPATSILPHLIQLAAQNMPLRYSDPEGHCGENRDCYSRKRSATSRSILGGFLLLAGAAFIYGAFKAIDDPAPPRPVLLVAFGGWIVGFLGIVYGTLLMLGVLYIG